MSAHNVDKINRDLFRHRYMLYEWRVTSNPMLPAEHAHFGTPHSILIVSDTVTPHNNSVLRSEVLLATRVLKECMAQAIWINHVTHPVSAPTTP